MIEATRLRKNRNEFKVHSSPTSAMSDNRFFAELAGGRPLESGLEAVRSFFLDAEDARDRFRWVLRDSLDELLDGQRTGRWCYQHLNKTERTHLGTAIEVNFTNEFGIPDGQDLDWRIGEIDVDCKFSKDFGKWEIPMEMYRCSDHGDQQGTADHPALLVWMDDDNSQWCAGITVMRDDRLAFKRGGGRGYNRDNKRKLSKPGIQQVHWFWGGLQNDLPRNLLLHSSADTRKTIFAHKSGQKRVNAVFREMLGQLVTRAVGETVAQQDDSMKRARDARLGRHLGREGIVVLGHQDADPHIAELLDLPVPRKGEFVSAKLVPTEANWPHRKVYLVDSWWRCAEELEEALCAVPPHKEFRRHTRDFLEFGR